MAKRKHGDDESDAEIIVQKKAKTDHGKSNSKSKRKHKRASQPTGPAADVQLQAAATIPSATPVAIATSQSNANGSAQNASIADTADVSSQVSVLQAPPGMSKGQRKRWRKKQKLLEAERSQQATSQQSRPSSRGLTRVAAVPEAAKPIPKPTVKKSLIQKLAVTQLMPRRQKQWHDEDPTASTNSSKSGREKVSKASGKHRVVSKPTEPSDDREEIEVALPSLRASRTKKKQHLSASSHSSSSSSESEADEDVAKPTNSLADEIAPSEKTQATMRARQFSPLTSTESINVRTVSPIAAARRTSFGNKATSIPTVSSDTDPVASFKRFSAWLHKDNSDSEDSASQESEPEAPATSGALPPSDGAEEMIQHVDATSEPTNGNGEAAGDKVSSTELARPISSDEVDVDQLPRFSDSLSQAALGNSSTWPANVGIKRQISFLGQELGGAPSGSGAGQDAEPKNPFIPTANMPRDPFEINDDSQELLQTMDEVSNTIFASTRPLPPSKKPRTSEPGNADQGNGDLTSASSSDRRVTRSMATPKGSQSQIVDENVGPGDLVNRLGLNEPSLELANEPVQNASPESSDSMGSNIVVAASGSVGNGAGAAESSGNVSELSRSPSPPGDAVVHSAIEHRVIGSAAQASSSDIYFTTTISEADAERRKKRKQTGTTSKHFTLKKATRKSASTGQDAEEGTANVMHGESSLQPEDVANVDVQPVVSSRQAESVKPRRRTRASSKAEDLQNDELQTENLGHIGASQPTADQAEPDEPQKPPQEPPPAQSTRASTKKRKSTGKKSTYFTTPKQKPTLDPSIIDRVDFYNTTTSGKTARVPAGTSIAPVPPITASRFGIIQEKLWREPFWLLIAVTFLNKTTGRAAVPVFWALKEKYVTPQALAEANQEDMCKMIHHLGLQNQRANRLISMAQAWVKQEPVKGRRHRTLNYPAKGDGKEFKPGEEVEADADDCAGALEVAHIPGCGPYARDSWRIFCRDVLRGVAEDYKGAGNEKGFVPEWKKVLPGDKELRACLRWMWLCEGWIWDHESGEKRRATEAEMEKAQQGEMEIDDPQERKFAAQAAGVEVWPSKSEANEADESLEEETIAAEPTPAAAKPPATKPPAATPPAASPTAALPPAEITPAATRSTAIRSVATHSAATRSAATRSVSKPPTAKTARPTTPEPPLPPAPDDDDSDNIVVTPYVSPVRKKPRKSLRTMRKSL